MARSKPKSRERKKVPILHASRRFFAPLQDLLEVLHDAPVHGNRKFQYDQLVVAHLLAFFNTSVNSLRTIEDIFESPTVRRNLKMPRVPKSTLADTHRVFDPELLEPIIEHLKGRVSTNLQDPMLEGVVKDLMAVDGTFFTVAPRVLWALHGRPNDSKAPATAAAFRADVHFDVLRGVPERVVVSDGRLAEQVSLAQSLESHKLYILDRAYQGYQLYASIIEADSDFVLRLRESCLSQCVAAQPLSNEAKEAGILRDEHIELTSYRAKCLCGTPMRLVEFECSTRDDTPSRIQLLTNRTDLPAEVIVLIYEYRWQVELFFRWLKCLVNLRHFFSETQNGATLQIYVAVIATLLLALKTEAIPNKYDFNLIGMTISGLMPAHEALAISERRHRERQRAKEARKKKKS